MKHTSKLILLLTVIGFIVLLASAFILEHHYSVGLLSFAIFAITLSLNGEITN